MCLICPILTKTNFCFHSIAYNVDNTKHLNLVDIYSLYSLTFCSFLVDLSAYKNLKQMLDSNILTTEMTKTLRNLQNITPYIMNVEANSSTESMYI